MIRTGMEAAIHAFPDYLAEAESLAGDFRLPEMTGEKIVVLGMGGSAIAGDLLQSAASHISTVPVHVFKGGNFPGVPRYIDRNSIVVAVSYSGNTYETLGAVETCVQRGTKNIIAISTGGKLKELAESHGFPHLKIPGELMPRAALPFLFVPLLAIMHKLDFIPDQRPDLGDAVRLLKNLRENSGPPRELAKKLRGKLPVIYAENPFAAPAAYRWKCQINENAKQPAYSGAFPEAVHNEIVGFTNPLPIHKNFSAIILRENHGSPRTGDEVNFFGDLVLKSGGEVHEVHAEGTSFTSNLLYHCYYGDLVSLYLAGENGVDPTPIDAISTLKQRMKERYG